MNLFPLRAELAVMNILSEHRIAATNAISLSIVTTSWRRYGLRERDLPHAISRLQTLGLIELHRRHGHQNLMLTEGGARWLRSPRSLVARLLLLPRYLRAQVSQFLSPPGPADQPNRRASDHHPRREM